MKRALAYIFCLFLLACVQRRDLSQNVVVCALESFPDGLHLYNSSSGPGSFVSEYFQSSLVTLDDSTEQFRPVLIKELPVPDSTGLVYRMELNDLAKWDDGSSLTVEDVVFSWKLTLCPLTDNAHIRSVYRSILDSAYKDEVHDNVFYVKVKTKHYNNLTNVAGVTLAQRKFWDPEGVLNNLTFADIFSKDFKPSNELKKWYKGFNDSKNAYQPDRIVGLGPYRVVEIVNNAYITLERKQNWWGDKFNGKDFEAHPDKIIFKLMEDPASGYLAIKTEDVDLVKNRGSNWVTKFKKLEKNENFLANYKHDFVETNLYRYMGLNMKPDGIKHKPFFTDVRVRRAMAYLCPMEEMMDNLYKGEATRVATIVPPFNKAADTTLKLIPYDIEKAKELLTKAGWVDTDGDNIRDKVINGEKVQFSFKCNYVSVSYLKEIALILQESMKKAGVELIPNPLDFGTMFGKAYDHDFDAIIAAWGGVVTYGDPNQIWGSKSWAQKGSNFVGFGDAESDSLIYVANTTLEEEGHLRAYRALQRKIFEEQPYVFFWSENYCMAAHRRFKNTRFFRASPNVNLSSFKLVQ